MVVPTLIMPGKEGQELWRSTGYITAADLTEALEESLPLEHQLDLCWRGHDRNPLAHA